MCTVSLISALCWKTQRLGFECACLFCQYRREAILDLESIPDVRKAPLSKHPLRRDDLLFPRGCGHQCADDHIYPGYDHLVFSRLDMHIPCRVADITSDWKNKGAQPQITGVQGSTCWGCSLRQRRVSILVGRGSDCLEQAGDYPEHELQESGDHDVENHPPVATHTSSVHEEHDLSVACQYVPETALRCTTSLALLLSHSLTGQLFKHACSWASDSISPQSAVRG